jgi:hypothetical protein
MAAAQGAEHRVPTAIVMLWRCRNYCRSKSLNLCAIRPPKYRRLRAFIPDYALSDAGFSAFVGMFQDLY